jgi:hypothetical protein
MSETTVVHCKVRPYDVYIGRPSKWGNLFTHLPHAVKDGMVLVPTREEAIKRYRAWIQTQPELLKSLPALKGKTLGCWCKPKECHGDVLKELADNV